MTETTEQNVNEAIDWLQKTGGSVQDFAAEQVPLYCREVVAWEFWSGVALMGGALLALLIGTAIFRKAWKAYGDDEEFVAGASILFGIFLLVPCLITITYGASSSIKAAVAPRVVIVEHLKDMTQP